MPFIDRNCQKLVAALMFGAASACGAHPLSDAAYEAMSLCLKVEELSLQECSTTMRGSSPEKAAARDSVLKMLRLHDSFMHLCTRLQELNSCLDQSDWYIGYGLSRLNEPVQYIDRVVPNAQRR
jgi:hypothetical protein